MAHASYAPDASDLVTAYRMLSDPVSGFFDVAGEREFDEFVSLVTPIGPLHHGDHLFRRGSPMVSVFLVRAGCVKSCTENVDGEEEVLAFHLSGDLAGVNGMHRGVHTASGVALDTVAAWKFPIGRLLEVIPGTGMALLRLMSRDLAGAHVPSAKHSADRKIAEFILEFGERMRERGFSATQFVLPMSRSELASYLHIAPETASRVLGRLERKGLIRASNRRITITSVENLRKFRDEG